MNREVISRRLWPLFLLLAVRGAAATDEKPPRGDVLVVVGAAGTDEYGPQFQNWAERWLTIADASGESAVCLGRSGQPPASLESLTAALAELAAEPTRPLWLVFIGHGTFDGRTAKFNLEGPDLSAEELKRLLDPVARPTAVINCTSASAIFLPELSRPGRVVLTATSSGSEVSFARFGDYLSQSLADPAADLDKDDQTSLLEAFLMASRLTAQFYDGEGRLMTEHAALDDNGDGRMVEAEGFDGVRAVRRDDRPGTLPDGLVAHQWHLAPNERDAALAPEVLARRNELERMIAELRLRKNEMSAEEYYHFLESLCLEMAKLLVADEAGPASPPSSAASAAQGDPSVP